MKSPTLCLTPAILVLALAPVQAQAATLNPTIVFLDATPAMKAVMLILVLLTFAAIAVCGRKRMSGPSLTGGSTFLSALRLGGPLLGLLAAPTTA